MRAISKVVCRESQSNLSLFRDYSLVDFDLHVNTIFLDFSGCAEIISYISSAYPPERARQLPQVVQVVHLRLIAFLPSLRALTESDEPTR